VSIKICFTNSSISAYKHLKNILSAQSNCILLGVLSGCIHRHVLVGAVLDFLVGL